MRILVYEHLVASPPTDDPTGALFTEGRAMLSAVTRDLALVPGIEVTACTHVGHDPNLSPGVMTLGLTDHAADEFVAAARDYDAVLCIAPEIGGLATSLARRLESTGVRVLGPNADFIEWATDKLYSAQESHHYLTTSQSEAQAGSIQPRSYPIESLLSGEMPSLSANDAVVVKPRDGVGALHTFATKVRFLPLVQEYIRREGYLGDLIVQHELKGESVSVAALGRGRSGFIALPLIRQIVRREPTPIEDTCKLSYEGGMLGEQSNRIRAARFLQHLREMGKLPAGYFGIDLILHPDDPMHDTIVDINPRITTSYIGYSHLFPGIMGRFLLGQETEADIARLAAADPASIRFYPDGRIEPESSKCQ